LFRAPNFSTATLMARRYLFLDHGGADVIPLWLAFVGPVLLVCQWMMRRYRFEGRSLSLSLPWFALAYGAVWALAIGMMPLGYRPFIYFQF